MPKRQMQTWLVLVVLAVGLVIVFVLGLWAYMSATATPIHPNPREVSSVTRAAPPARWAAAVSQAQEAAREAISAQNLPGLSVAAGIGDGVRQEVVWAEGFGWADLENRASVSPETRFRTGGISMALTSAAVGLLVERNQVRLDDEIHKYVTEYPAKEWPVTLRQLMGHVGGVANDQGDEEPLSERCARTVDVVQRFAKTPLRFEPGTRYRYSTYGWTLVSAAVESAARESFFSFMRSQVLGPLGMNDSSPDSETEPPPNRAKFYHPRFAGDTRYGPEPARDGDYSCFAGAGAFVSTPSDLVRFGMAMNSGRLLQPATVAQFQTSQRLVTGEETGYGLGW